MTALRGRWQLALLLAFYALPILAITAYFTMEELRGLAAAQNERSGLYQIARMNAALVDLSHLAQGRVCGKEPSVDSAATVRQVTADMQSSQAIHPFAMPDWMRARAIWEQVRTQRNPGLDRVMRPADVAISQISDRSGLTFDAQIGAVDLSDALTYRLPQAVASLEGVRYDLCSAGEDPALPARLEIEKQDSRAQTLLDDAFNDIDDAAQNGGMNSPVLIALSHRVQDGIAASSNALQRFILSRRSGQNAPAMAAVGTSIGGLYRLMQAEIPAIDLTIDGHIADHRRRMALAVGEGLAALFAGVVIGMLLTRLIYQYGALTAVKRMAAESEHRATHDPLTGLLNRRAFFNGSTSQGILCVIDVDDLKRINDTSGHSAGDSVLIHVAKVLQNAVRATDPVARLGGDEFALLLRTPVERESLDRALAKIFHAMRTEAVAQNGLRASISIGTTAVDSNTSLEEAFARADQALYRAKREARGSVVHG